MRYSKLFTKTRKTAPTDEITVNARLLVRAGFVNKLMAGVYSYLPLGLRVLKKIEGIIREEMDGIGGQELLLPALHPAANWKQTGAWDSLEVLFKIKSRTGRQYALGQSHEEVITPLVKEYLDSYKDLPLFLYQVQNKYRDELRAKSGILRGREFGMKDMYSFHLNQTDFEKFYAVIKKAYLRVFTRCGLTAKVTEASGGSFSEKISYEFMVLTEAGEDDILYCDKCDYCVNLTIAKVKKNDPCPGCKKGRLKKARASEVGNVFDLGQKYAKDFDLYVFDKSGKKVYPIMGCYGLGTTRLMGVIVEKYHDEKGIIWPDSVAPYLIHLLVIGEKKKTGQLGEKAYKSLTEKRIEVLFDDRQNVSAGEKLTEADLIGIPYRLVVSDETGQKEKIEVKKRNQKKSQLVSLPEFLKKLS
jgi:prolyl-tRNA synthetase